MKPVQQFSLLYTPTSLHAPASGITGMALFIPALRTECSTPALKSEVNSYPQSKTLGKIFVP